MNENNNRITSTVSNVAMDAARAAISGLEQSFSMSVGLSPEERMTLPKISVDNRVFVEDALNAMNTPTGASIMPAFLSAASAQIDLDVYEQMDELITRLDAIRAKLADQRTLAGCEAYTTALTFYKLAQAAAGAGIPGVQAVVDALRERFAGQGGSTGGGATS